MSKVDHAKDCVEDLLDCEPTSLKSIDASNPMVVKQVAFVDVTFKDSEQIVKLLCCQWIYTIHIYIYFFF